MTNPTSKRTKDLYRIMIILVGVWFFAVLVMMIVAQPILHPGEQDRDHFLLLLGGSGTASIVLTYLAYRLGLISRLRSLRYVFFLAVLLIVAVFGLNVWVTARMMFINDHDLGVTTVLLLYAGGTALGAGYFLSNALTERITGVIDAAKRLGKGDLSARVPVQGNDELAGLAATFNAMAARLQQVDEEKRKLEQTRRDLIAWVSHDLRTPLSALRVVVDALFDGVVEDEETIHRYLNTAQSEINSLNRLIDDLFELAQMDAGHLDLHRERTSLNDLISDTLSAMGTVADQRGIRLAGYVGQGVDPLVVDPQKIQRVLMNLLGNAIRHTPPGGEVSLNAILAGDMVRVDVRDTGEGIPAQDLPHIFERFYRGKPSRTREGGGQRGAGLGLAIVQGLIEAHGGHIHVHSEPGKGTLFTFTLPRARTN